MKRALQLRHLTIGKELSPRAPLPCNVITNLLDDLAALLTSITDYGDILRDGVAVCSTFMVSSCGESSGYCRIHEMAVDAHIVTPFVNREKAGHRKHREGFQPLL
eukprot:jgi/Tetstr1/459369/TSEL_004749.t1